MNRCRTLHLPLNLSGSTALITVILATAILLTFGLALNKYSIDSIYSAKHFENSIFANANLHSCLDMALFELVKNSSFTGNISKRLDTYSCEISITNTSSQNIKSIHIVSTSGDYTSDTTKNVDISKNPFVIENMK